MPISPYMNLELPTVSSTIGPQWASELNAAFEVVDAHDHTSGKGVPVPSSGLNINGDLPFNGYNISLPRAVRLTDNGSAINGASDTTTVYAKNGELYYNDALLNEVQITSGGSLNASSLGAIGGDYGISTALLAFYNINETFVFTSDTNEAAAIDCGPVAIRDTAASANKITLQSPVALASNYALTLPATQSPDNSSLIKVSTAGVMSYYDIGTFVVDSSNNGSGLVNLTLTGNLIAPGITLDNGGTSGGRVNFDGGSSSYIGSSSDGTQLQIAGFTDASVPSGVANDFRDATTRTTGTTVGVGGVAISASSGTFSTASVSLVDITNLSVTITTSGRPVFIGIVPSSSGASLGSHIQVDDTSGTASAFVHIARDGTTICTQGIQASYITSGTDSLALIKVPASTISYIDTPAAGTYVYKARANCSSGTNSISVYRAILVVYEL